MRVQFHRFSFTESRKQPYVGPTSISLRGGRHGSVSGLPADLILWLNQTDYPRPLALWTVVRDCLNSLFHHSYTHGPEFPIIAALGFHFLLQVHQIGLENSIKVSDLLTYLIYKSNRLM